MKIEKEVLGIRVCEQRKEAKHTLKNVAGATATLAGLACRHRTPVECAHIIYIYIRAFDH